MTLVFYVRGQALSEFVPDTMVSDTINYQNAEAHFSEDWGGLDKWLHLKSPDGVEYEARLVDDRVENLNLSAGRWEVWFHGSRPGEDGTDDLRITTDTTAFVVEQSGSLDGDPLPPIELTAAEQIAAAVTRAETEVSELREDVEQYKQDVDEAAQAVQAAKVAAEAAAVGAFGSQAAADQSAQAAHVSEQNAEKAKKAIEDMSVQTITLDTGADSTVTKEMVGDAVRLIFGIARGERGPEGPEGPVGASVERIERTSGTGAPGETDTYTGYLSNGETFSFSVYNGKDGEDGKDGSGTGDMAAEVYDPQGKATDIFQYADDKVGGLTAADVGAEPAGLSYGRYHITSGTDEDFLAVIDGVYASMSDYSVRHIVVSFGNAHPVLGGGAYLVRVYRASAVYGVITASCYAYSTGSTEYSRSYYNGAWKDFTVGITAGNISAHAAPAGFGLGGNAKELTASDDLNNITACGWYMWDTCPANCIDVIANGQMLVLNGVWGLVTQVVYGTKGDVVQRSCYYGTWQPWEWRDPPMESGVEYRTIERITDKAVYKKKDDGAIQYRLDGETEWKLYADAVGAAPASHTHYDSYYSLKDGTAIPANANLNDYKAVGNYYCASSNTAYTVTNRPNSISAFILKVEYAQGTSANYLIQTVKDLYGRSYVRYYLEGTWGSWGAVYSSNNKPTPADIGAAPDSHNQAASTITGGILAGQVWANPTTSATVTQYQVRNICAQDTDLTAGSSEIPSGYIVLVYE